MARLLREAWDGKRRDKQPRSCLRATHPTHILRVGGPTRSTAAVLHPRGTVTACTKTVRSGRPAARYTGCVSENGFYRFGRLAGVKFRKAKWMWQSATGSEADAIRAEYGVGRDMAAVILERTPSGADEEVQALLDRIGQELAAAVRNKLHRFQMILRRGGSSNSLCSAGRICLRGAIAGGTM